MLPDIFLLSGTENVRLGQGLGLGSGCNSRLGSEKEQMSRGGGACRSGNPSPGEGGGKVPVFTTVTCGNGMSLC